MRPSRMFISQEALDAWLSEGRAEIHGDELRDRTANRTFRLREGVRFLAEVTGTADPANLVGKVKDVDQLTELQAERMADSVIIGENAYEIQVGFVGTPTEPQKATPTPPHRQTIAALQSFFLNNVK